MLFDPWFPCKLRLHEDVREFTRGPPCACITIAQQTAESYIPKHAGAVPGELLEKRVDERAEHRLLAHDDEPTEQRHHHDDGQQPDFFAHPEEIPQVAKKLQHGALDARQEHTILADASLVDKSG